MDKTEIEVEFGNISIGDLTVRLGVKIGRENIALADADRIFCGRRIWGTVALVPKGDADQKRLPTMEDAPIAIEGAFDTKQVAVKPEDYSIGLTFVKKDIDISELSKFAKRSGTLTIVSVKDLEHEDTVDDEGWEHEMDRDEDDSISQEERQAYTEGCEAAAAGKKRRCPYKEGDARRPKWLRGFDDTEVSGADMRQCVACKTEYDGNSYDACPECSSTNFVRLEASEAE